MSLTPFKSESSRIATSISGKTLNIRFNNPARHNALSIDMWKALPPLIEEAEQNIDIRLIVFSGAGEKAFASGADISQFDELRAAREAVRHYESVAEEALWRIQHCSKPTLACIQGYCIGGGLNIAMSCDIRIASDCSIFSVPAARLGLGYRYSALKNLVSLIGPGAAKDLFFTARRIDAQEALELGLISRKCAPEKLDELLLEYTSSISSNAPLTIFAAKSIIGEILKPSPNLDSARCQDLITRCFESEDYAEGRQAFMEKRKADFKGN